VNGGGTGVSSTRDSFRYDFTTLTGNGQIVAQVSHLGDPSGSAAAGVMVRSSTVATFSEVSLMLNNLDNAFMLTRATTGGSTSSSEKSDSGDQWIKLVRIGNTFSTYISSNGSAWTLVGSSTVAMGATIDIGLAACSQNLSTTEDAIFKNVSVSGTVTS
jgi:regulation of enolase protein 1 (concanavalin A-like superfamily)